MILAIRTDKPLAELYLIGDSSEQIDSHKWEANRKLADELLPAIQKIVITNKYHLQDIDGIVIFTGEGSFTGLRIGTTVANTLAYSLDIPIVDSIGEDWLVDGVIKLDKAKPGKYVTPKYSSEPNITKPKA
ncbi:MAG TPA: tRNA (adenosine(37)-N6)-threonylcarbamoyltransferase complex dimerization subunit type 1 TsaB [Candidatus Saccharibacteria bacterium]|nr:tRNA (adenosine(37)-N6)-threonylcarbamoyltransferase complex dimerization subunit type 1 TsaB [Candidatus Saccharibacteria bacterium]HMT39673.1 tRNA (adenosine(37)-N6)-threonylcarbamoyltransferase complex dimerization subunit type 1 TsaB [Candidatus Saccharibacteria bacterium]